MCQHVLCLHNGMCMCQHNHVVLLICGMLAHVHVSAAEHVLLCQYIAGVHVSCVNMCCCVHACCVGTLAHVLVSTHDVLTHVHVPSCVVSAQQHVFL